MPITVKSPAHQFVVFFQQVPRRVVICRLLDLFDLVVLRFQQVSEIGFCAERLDWYTMPIGVKYLLSYVDGGKTFRSTDSAQEAYTTISPNFFERRPNSPNRPQHNNRQSHSLSQHIIRIQSHQSPRQPLEIPQPTPYQPQNHAVQIQQERCAALPKADLGEVLLRFCDIRGEAGEDRFVVCWCRLKEGRLVNFAT